MSRDILRPMTDAFLADTIALLQRTPTVIRALLGGLPDTWLETPDAPGGWRPRDVVGHLISAELDDWIPRAEIILRDGVGRPGLLPRLLNPNRAQRRPHPQRRARNLATIRRRRLTLGTCRYRRRN